MSINIDTKEVEKFSAYATKWWDKDEEFKTLHHINPVRLAYIESRCSVDGKYILDIGCGGGLLSEAIATKKGLLLALMPALKISPVLENMQMNPAMILIINALQLKNLPKIISQSLMSLLAWNYSSMCPIQHH